MRDSSPSDQELKDTFQTLAREVWAEDRVHRMEGLLWECHKSIDMHSVPDILGQGPITETF